MAITYKPKVGEILECKFGNFKGTPGNMDLPNFDGRIPPEMVKKRMVVVINPSLWGGVMVVPISSSPNPDGINRGWHVPLSDRYFKETNFYDKRDRWAKCDFMQFASRARLNRLHDGKHWFKQCLPRHEVTNIQLSIIKLINATSLLPE